MMAKDRVFEKKIQASIALISALLITVSFPAAVALGDEGGSTSFTITFAEEVGGAGGGLEDCTPLCPPQIPLLRAEKSGELTGDVNGNGLVDPGDMIQYTVTVDRVEPSQPLGMVYVDPLSPHVQFVEGSLRTSWGQGRINIQGEREIVYVELFGGEGEQNPEFPVEISFLARVDSQLPAEVKWISGQGTLYSENSPTINTDDPDTYVFNDTTDIPVGDAGGGGSTSIIRGDRGLLVEKSVIEINNPYETAGASGQTDQNKGQGENSALTKRIIGTESSVRFSVEVTNTDDQSIAGLDLVDQIDKHMTLDTESLRLNGQQVETFQSDETGLISLELPELSAGETARLTYRARVKEEVNPNLGHIGTRAYVIGEGIPVVFSDDPDTEIYGDRTTLLLRCNCNVENYLRKWEQWLERLSNAEPTLTPLILTPGTGKSSGSRVAAGGGGSDENGGNAGEEEAEEEPEDELVWVIFGSGQREDRADYYSQLSAGAAGEISSDEEGPDNLHRYWPRFAFFGAGKVDFELETGKLFVGLNLGEAGAGGAGAVNSDGNAYVQKYSDLPVYNSLSGSGLDTLELAETNMDNICGEEYLPYIMDIGLYQQLSSSLSDADLLRIVKGD